MSELRRKLLNILQSATRWWPLILALAGIGVLYIPAVFAPAAGAFHDDGIYLATAKALAEGDGYRIISLPTEIIQTKYPFLFPVSLAAVWRLTPEFPANLPALRLLTLFWTLLWCRFAYLLIKREKGSITAAVITLLTMCSPWVFFIATTLLSETLFAALTWAALFEFAKYEDQAEEPGGTRRLLLAALLSGAAAVTRVLGVCLIGSGVLALLARRRMRSAIAFAAVSAAAVVPWLAWTALAGGGSADGYYSASNYASWNLITNFAWPEKAAVLGHNVLLFFLTPGYLFGLFSPETIPLMLVIGGLTFIGLIARLRKGLRVLDLFLILYLFTVALWPWPPVRFLAPLYPLVLLLAWHGVETISSGLKDRGQFRAVLPKATVGVAVLLATAILGAASVSAARSGMVLPAAQCQDDWGDFEQVLEWVEANTPSDAVLASNLDPLLFLYTGRKAIRPFEVDPVELYYTRSAGGEALGPPAELARRLYTAGVDYVVTTPGTCFREKQHLERQLAGIANNGAGGLQEVAWFSPESRVYAVDRERLSP